MERVSPWWKFFVTWGVYGARVVMAQCCSVRQEDRRSTGSDPAARARPQWMTMCIVQMTFAERTDALSWLTRPRARYCAQ